MTDTTREVIPATPITPLPVPPVGMPRVPVTLFNVWTWNSPVIPQFYWNVYSAEQRIKEICKQIGKIEAYLDYAASKINEAHVDMAEQINKIYAEVSKQLGDLTNKLTSEVTRLEGLIAAEAKAREAADSALQAGLDAEKQARTEADAKLTTDLQAETAAREDADEALHTEISAETTARTHADDQLHAEISAEATARGEAISTLTTRVAAEESKREAEDAKLGARIDATNSNVQNNSAAIVTETKAREAADAAINAALATKLVRDDLRSSGKITLTPGEGNTITIGDSFEADFSALQSAIDGLKAALQSETSERRHDDQQLQVAVDARLERGKLLAGEGITVVNDPDQSTVTVSAKVTAGKLSAIEGKADAAKAAADKAQQTADSKLAAVSVGAGLTGDGTAGNPVTLAAATASTIGGIKVGEGLSVTEDGTLSATNQGGGTSGLSEVAHDSTLKGNGTSENPLGVAVAPQGALTAGEQGLTVNAGAGLSISESNALEAEVTQAKLDAVEGKADAAKAAATEAGSKAQAATEAATAAGSKAEAATEAANAAGSKAEAAQAAATQASSKADAAQAAADEAKAAAEGKLSAVAVSGPLTGDGTTARPLDVSAATATGAGVITENRVKELAGSTAITAENPLSVSNGRISLRMQAPLKTDTDGSLMVRPLDAGSSDDTQTGIPSVKAIRDCFSFAKPLKQDGGTVSLPINAPLQFETDGSLTVRALNAGSSNEWETGVPSIRAIRDCFHFSKPLKQDGGAVSLPINAPLQFETDGSLMIRALSSTSSDDVTGVISIGTIRQILEKLIKPEAFKEA